MQPQNDKNDQLELPEVTYRREVRVRLTDIDIARYGRQLSHKVRDRAAIDEKRKAVAAEYSASIKKLDEEITRLSAAMQNSEELRDLEVFNRYHAGTIEICRADTREVVDVRPATVADRDIGGADRGFPEVDPDGSGGGADLGDPGDAGDGQGDGEPPADDDDFGGAKARQGAKLELVKSATGDTVAHMPDDPDGDPDGKADDSDVDPSAGDVQAEDPQWDPDDADAPKPVPPPLKRQHDKLVGAEVASQTIKHQKKRGPKGPRKKPEGDPGNDNAPVGEKRRR